MKINYDQDTDSFFLSFGGGVCEHTVAVTDDFFVDIDSDDLLCGVESIGASRHLQANDLSVAPPRFQWVLLTDNESVPIRRDNRDRFFIYRAEQDTLFMELAGGEPVGSVHVTDSIEAQVDDDGHVVGLSIANASRSLDLGNILVGQTPKIEWVAHRATVTAAV